MRCLARICSCCLRAARTVSREETSGTPTSQSASPGTQAWASEAIDSTVEIARRCSFFPKNRQPILPRFAARDAADAEAANKAEAEELARQAHEGLAERIATRGMTPGYSEEDYRKRLDYELSVIEKMKYPGYFLVVFDERTGALSDPVAMNPGSTPTISESVVRQIERDLED